MRQRGRRSRHGVDGWSHSVGTLSTDPRETHAVQTWERSASAHVKTARHGCTISIFHLNRPSRHTRRPPPPISAAESILFAPRSAPLDLTLAIDETDKKDLRTADPFAPFISTTVYLVAHDVWSQTHRRQTSEPIESKFTVNLVPARHAREERRKKCAFAMEKIEKFGGDLHLPLGYDVECR